MSLVVIIHPNDDSYVGKYPTRKVDLGSDVRVGQAGELIIVSEKDPAGTPTRMRVYAPGTWKEFNLVDESLLEL